MSLQWKGCIFGPLCRISANNKEVEKAEEQKKVNNKKNNSYYKLPSKTTSMYMS